MTSLLHNNNFFIWFWLKKESKNWIWDHFPDQIVIGDHYWSDRRSLLGPNFRSWSDLIVDHFFLWSWSESDRKFQITIFPTLSEKFVEIWKNSQWFFANFRFFLKIASEKNITKGISMESVFSKFFKNFICDSDPCI